MAGRARGRESMGISRDRAYKWWRRYQAEGSRGARGSLEPAASFRHQTSRRGSGGSSRCAATLGPARIAGIVGMPASTVHRVLVRHGLNRLRSDGPADRASDPPDRDDPARRAGPHRHQEAGPDPRRRRLASPRPAARATSTLRSASQGRLRLRALRRSTATRRLAYSEVLADEQGATAPRSGSRAAPSSPPTASPSNASSPTTAAATAAATSTAALGGDQAQPHPALPTRRPTARSNASTAPCSTNGPTPDPGSSDGQRTRGLDRWLHRYNHHRHHTAIGGPPISRVSNLPGHYS